VTTIAPMMKIAGSDASAERHRGGTDRHEQRPEARGGPGLGGGRGLEGLGVHRRDVGVAAVGADAGEQREAGRGRDEADRAERTAVRHAVDEREQPGRDRGSDEEFRTGGDHRAGALTW
jgi:hypothetical protein